MPNPMSVLEYRTKREERRLAKYDLKKAKIELRKIEAQVTDSDALAARAIPRVVWAVVTLLVLGFLWGATDGTLKEFSDNRQVTACEKYVAEHQPLTANCSTGVIGKTTQDGK